MTSRECARARAAIDDLTALDRAAVRGVQDHATVCPDCARRLRDARRVNAYIRGLAPVPPPPDLLPRLLEAPRRAPTPGARWPRLALVVAALALLGALTLQRRGGELVAVPEPPSAAPATLGAAPTAAPTAVARRAPAVLITPAATAEAVADGAPAVVDAGPAVFSEPAVAPRIVPTDDAPPVPAPTEAPPVGPSNRPRPSPSDEPTTLACGSIVVRVFTDLAGADGIPCASCDGRLTDEDLAVARALALALPPLQVGIRAGEGASEVLLFEGAIVGDGQVRSQAFEISCDIAGPIAVELAGDLGPWEPCAAGAGIRQVVEAGANRTVEFALTTACAVPTPDAATAIPNATTTEPLGAATPDAPLGSEPAEPTPERGPDRP